MEQETHKSISAPANEHHSIRTSDCISSSIRPRGQRLLICFHQIRDCCPARLITTMATDVLVSSSLSMPVYTRNLQPLLLQLSIVEPCYARPPTSTSLYRGCTVWWTDDKALGCWSRATARAILLMFSRGSSSAPGRIVAFCPSSCVSISDCTSSGASGNL